MTSPELSEPKRRVSASAKRARQMMVGGLALAHAAGIFIFGIALAVAGGAGAISVAVGFAAVIIFFSIGQAIEVVACELDPVKGMRLALVSYAVRVLGISVGMWVVLGLPAMQAYTKPGWLVLAVTGTVVAWVSGVVLVASRQRVPIYDHEYVAPRNDP